MPDTMRAVDVRNGAGPLSALYINPAVPLPTPSPTEALIKVAAFGINRADLLQREGKYPVPPGVTLTLGLEFAGTIAAVPASTPDTTHTWKEGDAVFGLTYGGAYAEYVAVDMRMLLRRPAAWSAAQAAGVCETWMTALQALHVVGQYAPGTTRSVLWHAGASSVSIAGVQLSKAVGRYWAELPAGEGFPSGGASGGAGGAGSVAAAGEAGAGPRVFATARSEGKCRMVREELGADVVVNAGGDAHAKDWEKEVKRENGGAGVDLVIDYVGATYFQQNLEVAARDGRIVQLAVLGGTKLPEGVDISAFLLKRVRFEGSTLRSRSPEYQRVLRDLFERVVLPRISSGEFDARIEKVFKWDQIQEAQGALERNETSGKVVCLVE